MKKPGTKAGLKAGGQGLEPRFHGPEPHELPLFYPPTGDLKDSGAPFTMQF